ncbi:unknown [Firmicutes bacterium CAG:114]|nr:unknown [Firmicutes bacterium CAG:114]
MESVFTNADQRLWQSDGFQSFHIVGGLRRISIKRIRTNVLDALRHHHILLPVQHTDQVLGIIENAVLQLKDAALCKGDIPAAFICVRIKILVKGVGLDFRNTGGNFDGHQGVAGLENFMTQRLYGAWQDKAGNITATKCPVSNALQLTPLCKGNRGKIPVERFFIKAGHRSRNLNSFACGVAKRPGPDIGESFGKGDLGASHIVERVVADSHYLICLILVINLLGDHQTIATVAVLGSCKHSFSMSVVAAMGPLPIPRSNLYCCIIQFFVGNTVYNKVKGFLNPLGMAVIVVLPAGGGFIALSICRSRHQSVFLVILCRTPLVCGTDEGAAVRSAIHCGQRRRWKHSPNKGGT